MGNIKPVHLLAVSPHPTDFEFGVGGLAARLALEKKDVIYVTCTNGDKGTSIGNYKPAELAKFAYRNSLLQPLTESQRRNLLTLYRYGIRIYLRVQKRNLALILKYRPEVVATCDPSQQYFNHPDTGSRDRSWWMRSGLSLCRSIPIPNCVRTVWSFTG